MAEVAESRELGDLDDGEVRTRERGGGPVELRFDDETIDGLAAVRFDAAGEQMDVATQLACDGFRGRPRAIAVDDALDGCDERDGVGARVQGLIEVVDAIHQMVDGVACRACGDGVFVDKTADGRLQRGILAWLDGDV